MSYNPNSSQATIAGKNYNLVAFYYPGHNTLWDDKYQAAFLGNFWLTPITLTINGITGTFHTSEAAFQATKWWNHDYERGILEKAKNGDEAFKKKKSFSTPPDYSYAGLGRDGAMMKVLEAKFTNSDLKTGLLSTGDAYLLEHNSVKGRDDYWSDDHDGTGNNMLGILLMQLRQKLGGKASPYNGPVQDMTQNVQTQSTAHLTLDEGILSPSKLKIIPSVYSGDGKDGDFGWMIKQPKYAKTFFIFNDNVTEFEAHQNDPASPSGCGVGGGNAVIRPYQCQTPPKAGGIPTGPNFSGLSPDVKNMIDTAISSIKKGIIQGNYDSVVFSSDGHGGLGTSIFKVPEDVKTYIVDQINKL